MVSLSFIQAAVEFKDLPQGEKKWCSVDLDGGGLPASQAEEDVFIGNSHRQPERFRKDIENETNIKA